MISLLAQVRMETPPPPPLDPAPSDITGGVSSSAAQEIEPDLLELQQQVAWRVVVAPPKFMSQMHSSEILESTTVWWDRR
eukprot:SAG31_NODE_633_length_13382_cov_11.528911_3_plen_80_part_00